MSAGLSTLFVEELKALTRGRFAWLGAAVILLAVGGLATVGTQDTWLDGYGIIAYGMVPLAFIPIAAVALASPRANRFVESVFTAPVDRRQWLAAKIFVLLTLAAVYYAALVPMAMVYVHHVGLPFLFNRLLLWAAGLLLLSIAIGTLIGVLFIGRSITAPAATSMGVLMTYAGLVPLQELMVAQGNGASRTGHVTLLSPAVLLKNALGFSLVAPTMPATVTRTWMALAVMLSGALVLTAWTYLRAQGVETWETTRTQRISLAAAIVALTLLPVVVADTNYDTPVPRRTAAPQLRPIFGRAPASLAFVAPGRPVPARCCSAVLNRDSAAFAEDHATRGDLLVLLPIDAAQPIADVRVAVSGEGGLDAAADARAPLTSADLEVRRYDGDAGPLLPDGRHLTSGWVARVPVTLTPRRPWDVGGMRYPVDVAVTYRVASEPQPRNFTARAAIDAQIAPAIYEMGAVASVLPLGCLLAAVLRWKRTR